MTKAQINKLKSNNNEMTQKTQKKLPPKKQKTDESPDFFQLLRQEHGNSTTYIRFYTPQDKYTFNTFHIKNEHEMAIQQGKTVEVSLPINRIIYNTITDVLISNKFVYNNSKIMNSILDSGREMIMGRYVKKHFSWLAFLNRPEFSFLKAAYQSLNQLDQSVLEFTVLAVSNLMLKLSINISKLSCILTQRKYTTRFLSIPTLSLIFLQCLMHGLFKSKEISWQDELGKSQFIRQLPKITYIKISEILNKQQLLLMEFGEQVFFTSQTNRKVKNMQYLQFYEHVQNKDPSDYQRITGYEHIHSVNLGQLIPQGSPYGFELLFLFRTIYFNIIKDFNPDVIIFVEDYDNTKQIIEPEVRALILAEMMQNITGKVFVMRQVGFKWNEQTELLGSLNFQTPPKSHKMQIDIEDINNQQVIISSPKKEYNQIQEQTQSKHHTHMMEGLTIYETQSFLTKLAQYVPKMNRQRQQKLDKEQTYKINKAIEFYQKSKEQKKAEQSNLSQIQSIINQKNQQPKNEQQNYLCQYFSKVESILRDDLSYISLALIQRTSFQETTIKSHQYIYSKTFIQNVLNKTSQLLNQSEPQTQLCTNFKVASNQLKSMLENMDLETLVYFKNYYDSVYVIPLDMHFKLKLSQEAQPLRYYDEDYVHVYYGSKGELLVFLFRIEEENLHVNMLQAQDKNLPKYKQTTVLLRLCIPNIKQKDNYYYFDKIFQDESIFQGHKLQNPTFLITDTHIYRAFGISKSKKNSSTTQQSFILRAEFRHLFIEFDKRQQSMQSQNLTMRSNLLKWIQFSVCSPLYQKELIPLMQKQYGWVIYDQLSRTALFAGGYAPYGESRVNKYMHGFWEREGQIKQMGKTSAQIFLGARHPKAKIALFPFIYGIPFIFEQKCYILNTNGFFQCFTNCNKLFLTEMKLSQHPNDLKHGILSQRKLFVNQEEEDKRLKIVATKEFIVHFMVRSYRMVNIYQNKCILQTLDEGMLTIKLIRSLKGSGNNLLLSITTDRPDQNGEDFAVLQFKQYDLT